MTDRAAATRARNARALRRLERANREAFQLPKGYEFSAEDGAVVPVVSAEVRELSELLGAL